MNLHREILGSGKEGEKGKENLSKESTLTRLKTQREAKRARFLSGRNLNIEHGIT